MKHGRISRQVRGAAILLALSFALPHVCQAHTEGLVGPDRHVIVDTDMGLDDVRAVFALLADTTVQIEAFVTVEGSAALGKGTDNLVGLLEASRSGSVRVLKGVERVGLGAPPWREMANGLGGATFPPPRRMRVTGFTIEDMAGIIERTPGIQYLALGPLGNLGALEAGDPAGFRRIDTIYIPAAVRGDRISDYNLVYDMDASQSVLTSASGIVIIDISGMERLDGVEFLSSLHGESFTVLWIERLLRGVGDATVHVMLYDDLAAVAFLRETDLEFDERAFTAQRTEEGDFKLTPAAYGNIRVARLTGIEHALAALEELYTRGPLDRPSHSHTDEIPADALLKTFHGHLGPYVVIGYRMGKVALGELDSEGHFGVSAEVHSPLETPASCLIDGVQIGSGCTLGKRNIVVEEAPEPAWAEFTGAGGEHVTVRLRPGIPALVRDFVNARGVEAAGRAFFQMRPDSLFTVTKSTR